MENIKVRVNNEAESKEVQELFSNLGYNRRPYLLTNERMHGEGYPSDYEIGFLFAEINGYVSCADKTSTTYFTDHRFKELTIPQLRDLVVLKRNDVEDATHTCNGHKYYLTGSEFYEYINEHWENVDEWIDGCSFEPIEKKEMKEFLVNHNDKWTLQLLDADTEENSYRVAVPSGAEYMTMPKRYFWKDGDVDHAWCDDGKKWNDNEGESMQEYLRTSYSASIAWQRHTQPEELPFVDDEPKHGHYFKDVSDIDQIDVYEVLKRFKVTDPCLQHIAKKALCAGQRGHKDFKKDLQDILDTAVRAVDINK